MTETLKSDYFNESHRAVLFCGALCYAAQVVITFECVDVVEPPMKANAPYSYMKTVLLHKV